MYPVPERSTGIPATSVSENLHARGDAEASGRSGEIVGVHTSLGEHPEWVNEDVYGRGWIVAIAPDDLEEVESLLSPEEYALYVEERAGK